MKAISFFCFLILFATCNSEVSHEVINSFPENLKAFEEWESKISNLDYDSIVINLTQVGDESAFRFWASNDTSYSTSGIVYFDGTSEDLEKKYMDNCIDYEFLCSENELIEIFNFMKNNNLKFINRKQAQIRFGLRFEFGKVYQIVNVSVDEVQDISNLLNVTSLNTDWTLIVIKE